MALRYGVSVFEPEVEEVAHDHEAGDTATQAGEKLGEPFLPPRRARRCAEVGVAHEDDGAGTVERDGRHADSLSKGSIPGQPPDTNVVGSNVGRFGRAPSIGVPIRRTSWDPGGEGGVLRRSESFDAAADVFRSALWTVLVLGMGVVIGLSVMLVVGRNVARTPQVIASRSRRPFAVRAGRREGHPRRRLD